MTYADPTVAAANASALIKQMDKETAEAFSLAVATALTSIKLAIGDDASSKTKLEVTEALGWLLLAFLDAEKAPSLIAGIKDTLLKKAGRRH